MQLAAHVFMRDMVEEDLPAILAIEGRAQEDPWTLGNFRDSLSGGYLCQVLESNDQVIAHAVVLLSLNEAHLLIIAVDPEVQGQGLGRYFLHGLFAQAIALGSEQMFLEVRVSNAGARHLYESLGFQEIGRRKNYYRCQDGREDAVVMSIPLCTFANPVTPVADAESA